MSFPPPPPPEDQPGFQPRPSGAAPFGGYRPHGQILPANAGANGLAIASMVLGIVGVVLCCLFVPQLLAVIFGVRALRQLRDNPAQTGRGMAIAGLVLGLVSFALVVLVLVFGEFHYSVTY